MKIFYFWKPIVWLAIICYGLFMPANELPAHPFINIPHFDKLVHFSLFFGLCVLLFRPFKKLKLKHYYLAPASSFFLGLILETSQQLITTTRSSDFYDFLANSAGIATAILFYFLFVSNRKWEILF
jgi:VanZ family protein